MNKCSNIGRVVFVYDNCKNFLGKYDGVTSAQRVLHINHGVINKSALRSAQARAGLRSSPGFCKSDWFCYERLKNIS